MRGGRYFSKLISVLLMAAVLSIAETRPAYAICDTCVLTYLKQVILGTRTTYKRQVPATMVPGTNKPNPLENPDNPMFDPGDPLASVPLSLVDYFEDVWWKRAILLSQVFLGNQQAFMTALQQMNARLGDSGKMVEFGQDVKRMNVRDAQGTAGADEVLCGPASANTSTIAARVMAQKYREETAKRYISQMVGSSAIPDVSNGAVIYNQNAVKQRAALGLMDPTAFNGAIKPIAGSGDPAVVNADLNADNILGAVALDDSAGGKPTTPQDALVADQLFKNVFLRVPPTLSEAALKTVTPQNSEFLQDLAQATTTQSLFAWPLANDIAKKKPTEGLTALTSLSAILQKAGIPDDLAKKYIKNGKISQEAIDFIRYHVFTNDPSTITEKLTWSTDNLLRLIAVFSMQQVSLLYDIRENLDDTNILVGVAGNVLTDDMFENVYDKSQNMMLTTAPAQ